MSASGSGASRRTVTVLFCDVVDSTPLGERLDAEALRGVQGAYFDAVRGVLERHGGTVEKYIGDAVMAVFGLPALHEDDALRALRAASELHEAVAPLDEQLARDHGLRLRIRVGVATGEVVAGDPSAGHGFATGETVVVAERLERAAQPGEVLVGDATYRLAAGAAIVEPVDPIPAKGIAHPVAAWRLVGIREGAPAFERRLDTPLVGRRAELASLHAAFDEAVRERRCRPVAVLGPAGIGKSRLVREFLRETGRRATVRTGRCPPYGEGVTFWPIAEVLPDEMLEGTTDEIFWRVRKQFEALARERPLVLCFEDVHWGEPTFLNLLEYVIGLVAEAPILLVCLARPELADARPAWAEAAIRLDPLSRAEADELLGTLEAPAEARSRIAQAAEGNPLFVEHMAAMAAEGPGFVVPPSVRAVLAARLDRLDEEERAVVARAAVIGREFPWRAIGPLVPEELRATATHHLLALVRKDLLEPHAWAFGGGDDGFRFRHGLLRDAAYAAVPKELRADLHERYARWFEKHSGEDVIVGYHLEQAFRLREQLRPVDEEALAVAREAAGLLGAAGKRAFARADMPAARTLLRRAVSLLPPQDEQRRELGRLLANVLWTLGEADQADAMLRDVVESSAAAGDPRLEWAARLDRSAKRSLAGPSGGDDLVSVAAEAVRVFGELGEVPGLIRARRALGLAALRHAQYGRAEAEFEQALGHAREAGDAIEEARCADALCSALLFGPAEAGAAAERCRALLREPGRHVLLEANVVSSLAGLEAMRDRFAEARSLYGRAREIFLDLGLRMPLAGLTQISGPVELLAGDAQAAERELREGYEILAASGATGLVAPQAALLAETLLAQGRVDEAGDLAGVARRSLAEGDLMSSILVDTAQAMVELQSGEPRTAVTTAERAVAAGRDTDSLNLTADALVALALARRRLGDARAAAALADAVALYERKGNAAAARRARALPAESVT